jgi:hypothetical protein
MKVYIANFGSGNWAWPECLTRNALAVMDDERVHPFWQRKDQEGYVRESLRLMTNRDGKQLDKGTATRWYGEITILNETSGELWLHSDTKRLWWTISKTDPATFDVRKEPDPSFGSQKIYVYFKPCRPWSDRDKEGRELFWDGLHPKAKMFLMNQGTFQPILGDNASYVQALIAGEDVSSWHQLRDWREKLERSGKEAVKSFSAAEIVEERMKQTAARMVKTAQQTAIQSGQVVISLTKDKHFLFGSEKAAQDYSLELMKKQQGRCALTGLQMLLDDEPGDEQCRYSLDRIDSSKHYEPENLQLVCRFANLWKSASDNEEFKRLIAIVRSSVTGPV